MFAEHQFWIFHVQTQSYAEHKALDSVYEAIGEYKDKIAERVASFYPDCIKDLAGDLPQPFRNYKSKDEVVSELKNLIDALNILFNSAGVDSDDEEESQDACPSDILNLKDELVSELRQGVYMLTRLS